MFRSEIDEPFVPYDLAVDGTWGAESDYNLCRSDEDRMRLTDDTVRVFILGATASGKSALAMEFSEEYGGAHINIDPRVRINGMNIGTATPSLVDRYRIPQAMVNTHSYGEGHRPTVSPEEEATDETIDALYYGRLPVLVGGGVYLAESLIYDNDTRRKVKTTEIDMLDMLSVEQLTKVCNWQGLGLPFEPDDKRRLIKHIVLRRRRVSEGLVSPVGTLVLGVDRDAGEIEERIRTRTRAMFDQGLENEVLGLLRRTAGFATPLLEDTIGYREFREYVQGTRSIDEVEAAIVDSTIRFAEWQRRELRDKIPDIRWVRTAEEAKTMFEAHLREVWRVRAQRLGRPAVAGVNDG